MRKLLALVLALVVSTAIADTTGNVLSGTPWTGVTTGTLPTNRMPGSTLLLDNTTQTVNWSYSTATAAKTIAINNALSGSGIQVGGYNYTYDLRNMNGDDRQGSIDTMTVVTKMTSNTGSTLLTNTNTHNTKFDWTTFSGTQSLNNSLPLSGVGNLSISFTSRDTGFWSGWFGPEVRNVGMSINYTSDPCVTNPAYSPTCANYNTVTTSGNLLSGTTGSQAYAINSALSAAGSGAMIHGFDYGYNYSVSGRNCAVWDLFGACITGWNYSSASVNTTITKSDGTNQFTETNTHSGGDNGTNGLFTKAYRLGSSVPITTLNTFSITPSISGTASITGMYSNAVYTPDPCVTNPLSNPSCPNYAQAYHDQQCTINVLYASDCPGYAAAFLTQQCNANSLYSAQCPGYAQAYHDQQCSINPLFASDCPGYTAAYFTQQCNANPLYDSQCTGYAAAYHNQQCSLNPLYATDCAGYTQAYFTQQCNANALYDPMCPGYKTAYAQKNIINAPTATTTEVTATAAVASTTPTVVSPTVDSVLSVPSTTSATSTTSVTSVIAPTTSTATSTATAAATAPVATPAPSPAAASEQKKTDTAVGSIEKKSTSSADAKKQAADKAKEVAAAANSAKTMEDQAATQGLLVGLIGYVPGFSAYQNSLIPDTNALAMARQYSKPVVDNRSVQRRLTGASDSKWQEMVDSQYQLGK